jgi:hypothetical protein
MSPFTYMNDRQVAAVFAMSTPWVRGQRFKRAHGLPHILTLDAIYLGTSRRYLAEDVDRLAKTLASKGNRWSA